MQNISDIVHRYGTAIPKTFADSTAYMMSARYLRINVRGGTNYYRKRT